MTDDAPFGYKPDGTPYKRDPKAAKASWEARRAKAPGRNQKANTPSSAARTQQRAQAVFDMLTIPVAGLAGTGQALKSKPLIADAVVLGHSAPQIAKAVAEVADQDDRIARVVDGLVQTGPYAALFTAILPVAVQIAANHSPRFAQIGAMLGARPVDDILSAASAPPPSPTPDPPPPAEEPKADPTMPGSV